MTRLITNTKFSIDFTPFRGGKIKPMENFTRNNQQQTNKEHGTANTQQQPNNKHPDNYRGNSKQLTTNNNKQRTRNKEQHKQFHNNT